MTYLFGEFILDSHSRRLSEQEREVHLSPKAFDLLVLLVENRAKAISKADLHERLWPSTYVAETNLAGLVVEIRRALRDSADNPRFLRTIQRFGYRFTDDVRERRAQAQPPRSQTHYWLVWEKRQIALRDDDNVIGRAPDAAVWIDAAGVSRHHARIRLEGPRAMLEDLGSKNGTYVRGHRITEPTPLSDGDEIRFGSVVITFRVPPPVGSTETARA